MTILPETTPPASNAGDGMLPINAVERETGISKELLRMWERRYGFPSPDRDDQGDRIYSPAQIAKLRLIRRLLDAGFRPGKIIGLDPAGLEKLITASHGHRSPLLPADTEAELLDILKSKEPNRLREFLHHQLVRMGLVSFIQDLLQHANTIVGDAWLSGEIEIFEEHLYTEEVQTLIRQSIGSLRPAQHGPRVLLATPPEELHTLGILMVEALLRVEQVHALSFGGQMPVRELVQAADRHEADVIGLSFSAAFPANRAFAFLEELRFRLPSRIDIWAGGSGLRNSRRTLEGVQVLTDLGSLRPVISHWRNRSAHA